MAQIAKIESHTELKSSAEKFYGFFKNNMSSFVQMFPQIFKNFEVVGGGEIRAGSVTKWTYDIGEGVMAAKIKIQALDDGNTSITFLVLEGDLLKVYNSFKAKLQLTKAGNGGSIVKWTLEFEKANANSPDPKIYAEQAIKVSKGIDAYLGGLDQTNTSSCNDEDIWICKSNKYASGSIFLSSHSIPPYYQ